jgi:hypothetical protein
MSITIVNLVIVLLTVFIIHNIYSRFLLLPITCISYKLQVENGNKADRRCRDKHTEMEKTKTKKHMYF